MSEKQFYVYTHARPDGTVFYVGKGHGKRAWRFVQRNNYHSSIVSKYGKESIIVETLNCKSERHAFDLEEFMIRMYRRMGMKLANFTNGGDGVSGLVHSEESKKLMSLKQSNRNSEWRRKIGEGNKGKKRSDEFISKISAALRARPPISEETRKKLKDAWKLRGKVSDETRLKISMALKNPSEETRKKMSESRKNPSAETRAKIGAAHKGKIMSEESRRKMSEARKGRKLKPMSEETKLKLSIAAKKQWEKQKTGEKQ